MLVGVAPAREAVPNAVDDFFRVVAGCFFGDRDFFSASASFDLISAMLAKICSPGSEEQAQRIGKACNNLEAGRSDIFHDKSFCIYVDISIDKFIGKPFFRAASSLDVTWRSSGNPLKRRLRLFRESQALSDN